MEQLPIITTKKRARPHELDLSQKLEVIRFLEEGGGSQRKAAEKFNVSKGAVNNILKHKEKILKLCEESNFSKKRIRTSKNEEINQYMWAWFLKMQSSDLPISGPLIKETAKMFAEKIGNVSFKGSNGWLEKWCARHKIKLRSLPEKAAAASDEKVYTEDLCRDFPPQNIFNVSETCLYFKIFPDKSLVEEDVDGNKNDKITVLLAASSTGEKLQPVVIGKDSKSDSLQKLQIANFPVIYKTNSKACMTALIFEEWIHGINKSLARENRKIVLFLVNCCAHPRVELSHVKLHFLPPKATQPLDEGIIRSFKAHYRRRFLGYLISRIDTGIDSMKQITILEAIHWLDLAWRDLPSSFIVSCFQKCGFLTSNFLSMNCTDYEEKCKTAINKMIDYIRKKKLVDKDASAETFCYLDGEPQFHSDRNDPSYFVDDVLEEQVREPEICLVLDETDDEVEIKTTPSHEDVGKMIDLLKEFATTKEHSLFPAVMCLDAQFVEVQLRKAKIPGKLRKARKDNDVSWGFPTFNHLAATNAD